jgi:hypothetical protein
VPVEKLREARERGAEKLRLSSCLPLTAWDREEGEDVGAEDAALVLETPSCPCCAIEESMGT